jgi:predicted XRE-type DNA-binding protein
MSTQRKKGGEFVVSSGNVFADLGIENSDEELAKAQLALAIRQRIRAKALEPAEAAVLLDANPDEVADLMGGRAGDFSYDRLLRFLTALDVDVRIIVEPTGEKERGRILVVTA